ncbi:uncharacterized protein MONOS_13512 [Monocercomonoides exilis]|uniref:uncharacterized protein n=1 Tax=Monocercomonoides exilis TaxID=2049356 RepID=UPI00355A3F88|nr:hypothetical protein MONOS_13512 [Monocercomonoides exilis]|eukprot:MONOS_13512.1-p1 / transcript=MONOS_13512.1 / gene=MONOS_13512 / organism=Monocercomonoides_exilis_PA203 / gene_product=unspecified product / transcript_product=unspecified product / location=Mono_scaffold00838:22033-22461(-) / protein_length=143 / sequence_SO=supercontig / SO=protein_coding / is_pseudo=false
MTDEEEVSGVNVSLPPLLNPSSGSSSGSGSVSVPLYSQQGIVQQFSMQSQGILGIQGLIPTGAMNKQGSAVRLPPLGMQDSNEGGKAHEGRISLKKERLCELDRLPDLYGDDLERGMRRILVKERKTENGMTVSGSHTKRYF